MNKKQIKCIIAILSLFLVISFLSPSITFAQDTAIPGVSIQINGDQNQGTNATLQLIFIMLIIALVPTILLMMTCFTRIIIVLHFLRSAMATQQMPPNQILIGLALVLTFFLMGPSLQQVNETALKPLSEGTINQEVALKNTMVPFREFMFRQVDNGELALFTEISGRQEAYANDDEIPNSVLIPAFVLTELKKGFIIGFVIYVPFIVIDMIVASTLMAMGMMMLPPSMISLPFKILFFLMVDGWQLVIGSLMQTFR